VKLPRHDYDIPDAMRGARWGIAVIAAGLWFAGCGSGAHGPTGRERVVVTPAASLLDRPVRITVTGLGSRVTATLRASWRSYRGKIWRAALPVRADARGRATLAGTRLLTRMSARDEAPFFPRAVDPAPVRLVLDEGGHVVATASLRREVVSPAVHERLLTVRRDGLYGVYFSPRTHGRRPAVVAWGGSEGGLGSFAIAAALASHGYAALALAYFDEPGLPQVLSRIRLEYFGRALRWLARRPDVDPRRVVVEGGSRGGEAALLVGATFPRLVHGVIALVPSDLVNQAISGASTWTLHGREVTTEEPIRVERIAGPVLTASGGDDNVWGSSHSTQQIQQRLVLHHFRFRQQRLDFPRAGHDIGLAVPDLPAPTDRAEWGGSAAAGTVARAIVWRAILRYLRSMSSTR
jgi:dienelactone hydrolase